MKKKELNNRQKLDLIAYLCSEIKCDAKLGSGISIFAGDVYEIAHPHKDCPHKDWETKWSKVFQDFKKYGLV